MKKTLQTVVIILGLVLAVLVIAAFFLHRHVIEKPIPTTEEQEETEGRIDTEGMSQETMETPETIAEGTTTTKENKETNTVPESDEETTEETTEEIDVGKIDENETDIG